MSDQVFESINPATQEVIRRTAKFGAHELEQAERQARSWAQSSLSERSALLEAVADQLESRRDELAGLITAEMGRLFKESHAEIEKCAWVCRYYAEHGDVFLADETIESDTGRSLVAYQPLGAVLAVMPWNYPFWQVFRFAAAAVAAGNVGLLKHASNVMQCSASIEDVFRTAGAPDGLFTHLAIGSDQVEKVIGDHRVRALTLTGRPRSGRCGGSGAELLTGGAPHSCQGWYYQPTVISGVAPGMRAYSEELFGPVASILWVRDETHAVEIANHSEYGLGGSVWTQDRERSIALARRLECGCAFVNDLVKSDPRLPFGGIKTSGYGRELSHRGIREFVNAKTLWVD